MLTFPYKGLYNVSLKVIFITVKNDNFTGRKKIFYVNNAGFSAKRFLAPPAYQIFVKRFRAQPEVKMLKTAQTVTLWPEVLL